MADLVDLEDMQFYLCQISRFSCLLKNFGEPIISYTDRLFHSQQAITRNAPTILRQIFLRNRILVFVTFKFDNIPSMMEQPETHQNIQEPAGVLSQKDQISYISSPELSLLSLLMN